MTFDQYKVIFVDVRVHIAQSLVSKLASSFN